MRALNRFQLGNKRWSACEKRKDVEELNWFGQMAQICCIRLYFFQIVPLCGPVDPPFPMNLKNFVEKVQYFERSAKNRAFNIRPSCQFCRMLSRKINYNSTEVRTVCLKCLKLKKKSTIQRSKISSFCRVVLVFRVPTR